MRGWIVAAALLLAGPDWAQPVVDGKASVDENVGSFVENYVSNMRGPEGGVSSFRSIIAYVWTRGKLTAEEQDLFREVASGNAVAVTMPGKTINVPAASNEVLAIAKLFLAPPNLNTLWKQAGQPTLTLVEMSRWGTVARNRVTDFMANKLYESWLPSNAMNSYTKYVTEFNGVTNAINAIEDPKVKQEAKLLLKTAMEKLFVKAKAGNREQPPSFLYNFYFEDVGQPALPQ